MSSMRYIVVLLVSLLQFNGVLLESTDIGEVLQPEARKAEKKCEEYKEYAVDEKAGGAKYPYMAALGYGDENDIKWKCDGALISLDYVLTAARCVNKKGPVRWVRLGWMHPKFEQFNVAVAVKHPDYHPPIYYHDIALLKLDRPATPSPLLRPACLYTGEDPPYNMVATEWYDYFYSNPPPPALGSRELLLAVGDRCAGAYPSYSLRWHDYLPHGLIYEQFCAGAYLGLSTCQTHPGAPIQVENKTCNNFMIVGVASFDYGCGLSDDAGVYTKVSRYLDWIESVVWP